MSEDMVGGKRAMFDFRTTNSMLLMGKMGPDNLKKVYDSEQTSGNFTTRYFINFNECLFACVQFLKHLIKTFPANC